MAPLNTEPEEGLEVLAAGLRAAGLPARSFPGRLTLRLGRAGARLPLERFAPTLADPSAVQALLRALCPAVGRLAAGELPPLTVRVEGVARVLAEGVEDGEPLWNQRPFRLGPRLAVRLLLELPTGPLNAQPFLDALGVPLSRLLANWIAHKPDLDLTDPARLLLPGRERALVRVGATLEWFDPDHPNELLAALDPPALVPGERRTGCALPHQSQGELRWAPWRPPAEHPLHPHQAELELDTDLHDYNLQRASFEMADRSGAPWTALRTTEHPSLTGRRCSEAGWPLGPVVLPAADRFRVETRQGAYRVWADDILDLLSAHTRPEPGAWPPRFRATEALPEAALRRIRVLGERVPDSS
jgi:hypothetical protein